VKLAVTLQQNGFPFVSVLEGGYGALVSYLENHHGGGVEPVIINHDPEKWRQFARSTGLDQPQTSPGLTEKSRRLEVGDRFVRHDSAADVPGMGGGDCSGGDVMEEVEMTLIAMKVADKLGHSNMSDMLRTRLARLGAHQSTGEKCLTSYE